MKKRKVTPGGVIRGIAMAVCIVVFLCCAVYLIRLALESRQVSQSSRIAFEQYVTPNPGASDLDHDYESAEDGEEETPQPAYTVDFEALKAVSAHVAAWIQISGIDAVNYPVVWSGDNSYYLDHTWDGKYSRYGAIFLEAANASDFSDCYSIIYGHNMKDGSMFGGLKKYRSADFFAEHGGIITLYLPEETRTYQIFSVRQVVPDDLSVYTLGFAHDESFADYIRAMKANSLYQTGVEVSKEDDVLTLSTCAGENRLIVHAKLVSSVPVS